jgi:putative oxidoreductase
VTVAPAAALPQQIGLVEQQVLQPTRGVKMKRLLSLHADKVYSLMRIVIGFLFLCHGVQKTFGALGGTQLPIASMLGVAGIIELIGGSLIMLGLLTRWAAFVSSGQMAAAYFIAHFGRGLLPIQNGGELAALYSWVFLFIAAYGSGPWSLDALRKQRGQA